MIGIEFDDTIHGPGAPHPIGKSFFVNWRVVEGRELMPEDVFLRDSGWGKFLADQCFAFLSKQDGSEIKTPEALDERVAEPKRWRFGKDGLMIHFNVDELAGYALGAPDVLIPWADLKPYLTPAGMALAGGSPI